MRRTLAVTGCLIVLVACGSGGSGGTDVRTGDVGALPDVHDTAAPSDAGEPPTDHDVGATPDAGEPPSAQDGGADTEAIDTDADIADTGLPLGGTLDAVAACPAPTDPCAASATEPEIHASYRKDAYLPDELYNEYTSAPLDGGRFQIAGVAAAGGAVTDVRIDGVSVADLTAPPTPRIEWYHVWPDPVVTGEAVWVAFHSRDPAWDVATEGAIVVETAGGVALDGAFPVVQTPAPLTYVAPSDDRSTLLVHVQNRDARPHTATRLLVNGRDVLGSGVACAAKTTVAPGEAALWTVPLCTPAEPGAAWTVVVDWADAPPAVGVGRVLRPHFPVEAWGVGSDCVAPGAAETGEDAYRAHVDAGFDTLYLYWGGSAECGYRTPTLVNEVFPAAGEMYALVGDDFFSHPAPETAITDPSRVAGFLTGDESDGQIYDDDGAPRAAAKAATARRLWSLYPGLSVYNGAMTNGNVGTFAGMVDVQGIDVYIAACAPYITYPTPPRPLTAPHDYLRNARENHMPGTTWFYAQGLHGGWNVDQAAGRLHFQPDPHEILLQAMMVLTAGGKGLMWFQTSQSEARHAPERWDAVARANWMIRSVRRLVREGDVTGAVTASDGAAALVEAIRGRDAIVVPVVNLDVEEALDEVACFRAVFESRVAHWRLGDQTLALTLPVPADLALYEVFEVTTALTTADAPYTLDVAARSATLPAVTLSNDAPVRLFVLAAAPTVRAEVDAVLADARGRAPFLPAEAPPEP